MSHTVQVVGKLSNGPPFANTFTFESGHQAPTNELTITSPSDDAVVGNAFTISGHTLPNARVHIVVGATAMVVSTIFVNFAFWVGGPYGDSLKSTNPPLFDRLSRTLSRPRHPS